MIDELLERLAAFGENSHPRISDLEEAVGAPIFVDVDDRVESTTEIHRPEAFAKGPFLFASIHGRHLRITKNDPIAMGAKKLVLRDGAAGPECALVPDGPVLEVGHAEKIEGKHVEIRSHRGWTDETGFTPLIRRLTIKTAYDSLEPPHRRSDRELRYVSFVLVAEAARVTMALGKDRPVSESTVIDTRRALHPFYVGEIRAGRTRLEWYAEAPSLGP